MTEPEASTQRLPAGAAAATSKPAPLSQLRTASTSAPEGA